jgi:hypothetical protein
MYGHRIEKTMELGGHEERRRLWSEQGGRLNRHFEERFGL